MTAIPEEENAFLLALGDVAYLRSLGIADSDAAMAKAKELRTAGEVENEVTIKDAVAAQEAIANGLNELNEFYAKAGGATGLVQQPEAFEEPNTGKQSESNGMIEVTRSDSARPEAGTVPTETANGEEHAQVSRSLRRP